MEKCPTSFFTFSIYTKFGSVWLEITLIMNERISGTQGKIWPNVEIVPLHKKIRLFLLVLRKTPESRWSFNIQSQREKILIIVSNLIQICGQFNHYHVRLELFLSALEKVPYIMMNFFECSNRSWLEHEL